MRITNVFVALIAFVAFAIITINANAGDSENVDTASFEDLAISVESLSHMGSFFGKGMDVNVKMSSDHSVIERHIWMLEELGSGVFVSTGNSSGTITSTGTYTNPSNNYRVEEAVEVVVISHANGDLEVRNGFEGTLSAVPVEADSKHNCVLVAMKNEESFYLVVLDTDNTMWYRYKAALAGLRTKLLEQALRQK